MITVVITFLVKQITKPKTINKENDVGGCKCVFGLPLTLRRAKCKVRFRKKNDDKVHIFLLGKKQFNNLH